MSLLTEILKEAPLSAVLQERVKALELDNSELKRQLEESRCSYQVLQEQHQMLVAEYEEDIRIHPSGIEFRRGKRTGGHWIPFCPKCHMPARVSEYSGTITCSAKCS